MILLLASITVVTIYYRGHARTLVSQSRNIAHSAVDPVGHLVAAIAHPIEHFFQGAVNYSAMEKTNARLREENQQLTSELKSSSLNAQEADQLKQQANLPYLQGISTVRADVIDTSPSNFESAIVIDKGTTSGIADGMPVVSGSGLVGIVIQASNSSSVVQLITDASIKIGVRFDAGPGIGAQTGVVDGQGEGNTLRVEYVAAGDHISKGEVMFTSGLQGGILPPDIPVGRISKITAGAGSLAQNVSIEPVAYLSNLQYVSVALWEPAA